MKGNWRMNPCVKEAVSEDVAMAVGLSQQEFAKEFVTLWHMEILRGLTREGGIYFALFEKKRYIDGE